MGADQEVGHDPTPAVTGVAPAGSPEPPGQRRGGWGDRVETYTQEAEYVLEGRIVREVSPHLRPHDLTRDQGSRIVGSPQGLP